LNALAITSDGSGSSLSIVHNGTTGNVINIDNSGGATNDISSNNWFVDNAGKGSFGSLNIGGVEVIDSSRDITSEGITATSLTIGGSSIIVTGAATLLSANIGSSLVISSSGAFDMGSGAATINTTGDGDFNSLAVNGQTIFQTDGFFVPQVTTDPISPTEGQMWLNTTDVPAAMKIFIGGATKIIVTG